MTYKRISTEIKIGFFFLFNENSSLCPADRELAAKGLSTKLEFHKKVEKSILPKKQ